MGETHPKHQPHPGSNPGETSRKHALPNVPP